MKALNKITFAFILLIFSDFSSAGIPCPWTSLTKRQTTITLERKPREGIKRSKNDNTLTVLQVPYYRGFLYMHSEMTLNGALWNNFGGHINPSSALGRQKLAEKLKAVPLPSLGTIFADTADLIRLSQREGHFSKLGKMKQVASDRQVELVSKYGTDNDVLLPMKKYWDFIKYNLMNKPYIKYTLNATEEQKQAMDEYLISQNGKKAYISCVGGVCRGLKRGAGIHIPFPFSQSPTLNMLYLESAYRFGTLVEKREVIGDLKWYHVGLGAATEFMYPTLAVTAAGTAVYGLGKGGVAIWNLFQDDDKKNHPSNEPDAVK